MKSSTIADFGMDNRDASSSIATASPLAASDLCAFVGGPDGV